MGKFKELRSKKLKLSLDTLELPNGHSFKGDTTDVTLFLKTVKLDMGSHKTTFYSVQLEGEMIGSENIYFETSKKEAINHYNNNLEALAKGNYEFQCSIDLFTELKQDK